MGTSIETAGTDRSSINRGGTIEASPLFGFVEGERLALAEREGVAGTQ
jgi:hypothetical protein